MNHIMFFQPEIWLQYLCFNITIPGCLKNTYSNIPVLFVSFFLISLFKLLTKYLLLIMIILTQLTLWRETKSKIIFPYLNIYILFNLDLHLKKKKKLQHVDRKFSFSLSLLLTISWFLNSQSYINLLLKKYFTNAVLILLGQFVKKLSHCLLSKSTL